MHSIIPPKRECGDPDRLIECQQAIELRFLEMVDPGIFVSLHEEAIAAGWNTTEVRTSILKLVHSALAAELGDEI